MFTRCIGVIECGYMSDTSINDNIDNEVDVLSEYFEVKKSGDVYYTFRGAICSQLKGGVNNVLYGKRVNLSEMYGEMIDDIIECITSGVFFRVPYLDKSGYVNLLQSAIKYTSDKYGISIEWMDNIVNNRVGVIMNTDRLYECMIDRVGGVDNIDWMSIYDRSKCFITNNGDILLYIANRIISDSSIYKYFVDRYKLRATGVDNKNFKRKDGKRRNTIKLEWDGGGSKRVELSSLVKDKRSWWRISTEGNSRDRVNIRDYDRLLNGRSEDEVLPDLCPIDNNIVLNYTRIDFSINNDNNIGECKRHNDIGGSGNKIWSSASIDRIDSNSEYSYDNIEIISQYYNTQVKNCASHSQIGKLYYYQLKKLLSKKISKELVKSMSDDELYKVSDMFSIYFKLFEIVSDNSTILHKEMVRRDKKRSKLQLVDPGEIG